MATPGDLSSKKVKNTYKGIVQYSGANHRIYDGTGSAEGGTVRYLVVLGQKKAILVDT